MTAPALAPLSTLAQAPLPPMHPLPFGMSPVALEAAGAAVVVGIAALLLVRWRRARARKAAPLEQPPAPAPGAPPVALPPSEEESARRREAEEARRRADALARERREAAEAAAAARAPEERARLSAEAQALKEREEEAKREEYRAQKAAERELRDRKAREREEADQQRAAAEVRAREEAEARARQEEAEAQRRVQAEAGRTLAEGLAKTRSAGFMARLNGLLSGPKVVDERVLGELEEVLFTADIGVRTAARLVELAREKLKARELADLDRVKGFLRAEVERILSLPQPRSLEGGGPPHVVMVVGVNGAGKTTTIGKLAAQRTREGKRVVLAAGDTFRAAATEQLDVWADRAHAELIKGPDGADPSSVVFEAVRRARETGADLVLADTAGRLHTKAPLMDELKKVRRVMDKALPGAPHEVLLVLDATNGQNAIAQARQFQEAVQVTDIALTKLDGTAKGGVIIGISDELKIPVAWVGLGEKLDDLRRFDAREFVSALFE